MSWPASEASQAHTGAIWLGLCSGASSSICIPREARNSAVMRVVAPGEIVFTVQPYLASSSASTRERPAMPALAAA